MNNIKFIALAFCLLFVNNFWVSGESRGKCGVNVYWELTDNGTLVLSGNGKMECNSENYPFLRGGPWCLAEGGRNIQHVVIQQGITNIDRHAFSSQPIKSVIIPESVKEIEIFAFANCKQLISLDLPYGVEIIKENAFNGCENLSAVSLPNSLSEIGESCFMNCSKLKNIVIPSNVRKIGNGAFTGCAALITVSITDGVEYIGDNTFSDCINLTHVTIPESINHINNQAFANCSRLTDIYVASDNVKYYSKDGVLFRKDSTLILYPEGKIGEYTVPNDIKCIAANAFSDCNGLTSVTIPNGLTTIEEGAFLRCLGLTSITLPNSINNIGFSAFMGCDNLLNIYIPKIAEKKYRHMDSMIDHIHKLTIRDDLFYGSDIDINIPTNKITNNNTFAVIIANEHYQNAPDVPYALNDGKIFAEYCHITLGIPQSNIRYIENGTLNNIQQAVLWLKQITESYDGLAKIIFYYSGHGIPNEKDNSAYLLPVDGDSRIAGTGFKIDRLYYELGTCNAKSATIFLDACFSGRRREGNLLDNSSRGVALSLPQGRPQGNMIVFAASQGDEGAYPNHNQEHGMFTYFLLKKIQDSKGDVTYSELSEYVINKVQQQSLILNDKLQTPSLIVSPTVQGWQLWKLTN